MRTLLKLALAVVCLAAMPGCMIPVPNRSVDAFGVESKVVGAQSGRAIPFAQISDTFHDLQVRSDADGRFRIASVTQWHAGYLVGPISYPVWPATADVVLPCRSFFVSAAGYEGRRFVVGTEERFAGDRGVWVGAILKDDVLYVSEIRLKRVGDDREGSFWPQDIVAKEFSTLPKPLVEFADSK
jgi:hypothetical protein